jgi:hypothetical protein
MPAKKTVLTDEERRKRIREAAREICTSNDPKALDESFDKVVKPSAPRSRPSAD